MAAAPRKPDFLIIGTQKAGTTWLKDHLDAHPQVGMVKGTPNYFNEGWRSTSEADYLALFDGMEDRAVVGEKTTEYLDVDEIDALPARIAAMNPHTHVIAMLRDPVERALSAVDHMITAGRVPIPDDPVKTLFDDPAGHHYIERGEYARQIEGYLRSFPRDQILVLGYEEDVVQNPEDGLRKTQEFLQIEARPAAGDLRRPVNRRRLSPMATRLARRVVNIPYARSVIARLDRLNPTPPYRSEWPADLRDRLAAHYAEPNERLFTLLGRRFDDWRMP